uniref:Uncharacterized protein n=1 Tax=Setaria viridis TaxID=4556 RepID=A0A4U6TQQ2_SETVI|nr:hypothetical protein SEVIR_8G074101v2 [Setaria viridis]
MKNRPTVTTDNNDPAAEDHMKKLGQSAEALYSSRVLPLAREVAQELISIKDEAERWDLVATVWAEMLYCTAPRCGAAFHAEHLAMGGESVAPSSTRGASVLLPLLLPSSTRPVRNLVIYCTHRKPS